MQGRFLLCTSLSLLGERIKWAY